MESGGYIVINPTEALVSIDVNSGQSIKEINIEKTALKTNLEAGDEISRQIKIRDLSGLIVIDFIDMLNFYNRRLVEKNLREKLKDDIFFIYLLFFFRFSCQVCQLYCICCAVKPYRVHSV